METHKNIMDIVVGVEPGFVVSYKIPTQAKTVFNTFGSGYILSYGAEIANPDVQLKQGFYRFVAIYNDVVSVALRISKCVPLFEWNHVTVRFKDSVTDIGLEFPASKFEEFVRRAFGILPQETIFFDPPLMIFNNCSSLRDCGYSKFSHMNILVRVI